VALGSLQEFGYRPAVEELEALGLVDGTAEQVSGEDHGQVEKGVGDRGDRNPILDPSIRGKQIARAVHPNLGSGSASPLRDGDVDRGAGPREQAEVPRGGLVAEQRVSTKGKYGCHPVAVSSHAGVTDGINAPVQGNESAGGDAVVDRAGSEAKRQELPARHDSVLPSRELSDQGIVREHFPPYDGENLSRTGHGPRIASDYAQIYAQLRPNRAVFRPLSLQ
jgi:hypothetical protein